MFEMLRDLVGMYSDIRVDYFASKRNLLELSAHTSRNATLSWARATSVEPSITADLGLVPHARESGFLAPPDQRRELHEALQA